MPKRSSSSLVLQHVNPPDSKSELTIDDLSDVLVRRLGLKRKESKAKHDVLLKEMIKYKKDNVPVSIEQIAGILGVSQSQCYEEIRKWRTLGLLEFVKIPAGAGIVKGYMISGVTMNRMLDKVESEMKSFLRKTRRIAKDFDDLLMLDGVRKTKQESEQKIDEKPTEVQETAPQPASEEDKTEENN
ncbi:MAG: helix-turn-helix domain-containing protein [Candidatus Aenigmarchaeota archaeon]|nr:helix-turn-helix domain-containing protein [Candidatus Aenigmarchaeota archaeon]